MAADAQTSPVTQASEPARPAVTEDPEVQDWPGVVPGDQGYRPATASEPQESKPGEREEPDVIVEVAPPPSEQRPDPYDPSESGPIPEVHPPDPDAPAPSEVVPEVAAPAGSLPAGRSLRGDHGGRPRGDPRGGPGGRPVRDGAVDEPLRGLRRGRTGRAAGHRAPDGAVGGHHRGRSRGGARALSHPRARVDGVSRMAAFPLLAPPSPRPIALSSVSPPDDERAELLELLRRDAILHRPDDQPVLARDGSSA